MSGRRQMVDSTELYDEQWVSQTMNDWVVDGDATWTMMDTWQTFEMIWVENFKR